MNKEEIFETIVRHVREVIPSLETHRFQPDDSLKALGANSVDRADIIMMTLESLSLNIPLIAMAKAENIGDLARIMHEQG
ncbi:acyl carrier protein [Chitiniphilus purpureus]|uniref:Acyl carrier protein n=1 Tax=Chitiniphilus purpureus TaxID=2981137 RepID=A0ABY6DPD3_9NEIS|nr:acyl carrier protein [Chitiniphilus sp. CD1]UXY16192.1 acyl carrier protein [Chitiniphilus sp. CD1]